jgi:hypothetical protein
MTQFYLGPGSGGRTGILCLRLIFAKADAESPNSWATARRGAFQTFSYSSARVRRIWVPVIELLKTDGRSDGTSNSNGVECRLSSKSTQVSGE